MKYLYIENGQGFFSVSGLETDKQTIDKIRKEDLLRLLNLIVDESAENGFEMDPYDEESLKNPAHKIIYKKFFIKSCRNSLTYGPISFGGSFIPFLNQ